MEQIADGIIILGLMFLYLGLPLLVLTAFFENTKVGRRLMDKLMHKLGLEDE